MGKMKSNNTGKQGKVVHTLLFCKIPLLVNLSKTACWGSSPIPTERPQRGRLRVLADA
jgi:hypothetical protein